MMFIPLGYAYAHGRLWFTSARLCGSLSRVISSEAARNEVESGEERNLGQLWATHTCPGIGILSDTPRGTEERAEPAEISRFARNDTGCDVFGARTWYE